MISLQQAREIIVQKTKPLEPHRLLLPKCHQQILHEDIVTDLDLPPFDNSSMDGYAILATETQNRLKLVAEQRPGLNPPPNLNPGECMRIFTGAKIPPHCVVIRQEDVQIPESGTIEINGHIDDRFVRRQGSVRKQGDRVLKTGTQLGPNELAAIASVGVTEPLVSIIPKIAHLVTGDEIIPPYNIPKDGQIRDSNSTLIRAMVKHDGAEISQHVRFGDDFEALSNKLHGFMQLDVSCILISGGASVGAYDYGAELLKNENFKIHFNQVNVRPGKPIIFATKDGMPAFVIPGNPASHHLSYHLFIRLAIQCLKYKVSPKLDLAYGNLACDFDYKASKRHTFWPIQYQHSPSGLQVTPKVWHLSGDLIGLTQCNGLMSIEAPGHNMKVGDTVSFLTI